MKTISKKKLNAINNLSVAIEAIKNNEQETIIGEHWTSLPPSEWYSDQNSKWDIAFEIERNLKQQILIILNS